MSSRLEDLRARFKAQRTDRALHGRGSRYLPRNLHAKQLEFITLPHREAMFGGAAGGGKTETLLAGALMYVDQPQFSGLILRRTFTALRLRGSIMDRAREWLSGTDAQWDAGDKRWVFPSGATLQFGYCDSDGDLERYKSAEFHYIAVDELTEWPAAWYGFLFSRLRKTRGDGIPLKMRAATNPNGLGAEWVRRRFGIPLNEIVTAPIVDGERAFMPARAEDNPSLDVEEYEKSLAAMTGSRTSALFQQLRFGRWMRNLEGLVYAYREDLNAVDEAPHCAFTVLGIDYGTTKATSFSVLGWNAHDPTVYVLESTKYTNLSPAEASEATVIMEKMYGFHRMVGDIGGLGKGYAEEARKHFQMPVEPAQKNNKRGYIKLFNGELERGRVKVVKRKCEQLIAEWLELPWAANKEIEAPGFENHCADGTLYAWRETSAYHERPEDKPPKPGTPEFYAREEQRLETYEVEQLDRELRSRRPQWYRPKR